MTREKEALSDAWPEHAQMQLSRTLGNATDIAAKLAFTDWATHARTLAVRRFYRGEEPYWEGRTREMNTNRFVKSPLDIVPIITDSFQRPVLARGVFRLDWAGVDLDGLVVLMSALTHHSLENIRGCFHQLRLGRIIYDGASADSIQIDGGDEITIEDLILDTEVPLESKTGRVMESGESKAISTSISGIGSELRQTCTLKSNIVWLKVEYRNAAIRWLHVNPLRRPERLTASWVTQPCSHGNDSSFLLHRRSDDIATKTADTEEDIVIRSSSAGLIYNSSPKIELLYLEDCTVYFPQFERRLDGAWLTYLPCFDWNDSSTADIHVMRILQKDTCPLCVLHQISRLRRQPGFHVSKVIVVPWCERSGSFEGLERIPADFQTCQEFNAVQRIRLDYPEFRPDNVRYTTCPALFHTSCCASSLQDPEENRLATMRVGLDENGERLRMSCAACVPRLCSPKTPCKGCQKIYNTAHDEYGTKEAEGEKGAHIHSGDSWRLQQPHGNPAKVVYVSRSFYKEYRRG